MSLRSQSMIFIKTRKERLNLSKKFILVMMTRGVPGTPDINIMLDFLKNQKDLLIFFNVKI